MHAAESESDPPNGLCLQVIRSEAASAWAAVEGPDTDVSPEAYKMAHVVAGAISEELKYRYMLLNRLALHPGVCLRRVPVRKPLPADWQLHSQVSRAIFQHLDKQLAPDGTVIVEQVDAADSLHAAFQRQCDVEHAPLRRAEHHGNVVAAIEGRIVHGLLRDMVPWVQQLEAQLKWDSGPVSAGAVCAGVPAQLVT